MKKTFEIGDLLVLNNSRVAVLWVVLEKEGDFLLGIKDASKGAPLPSKQKMQWIDRSFAKKPTKAQLAQLI